MNNSRILKTKNVKLSGYYFYKKLNILGDFQICYNKYFQYLTNFAIKVFRKTLYKEYCFLTMRSYTNGFDGSFKHPQNTKRDKRCRNETWGTANSFICFGGSGNKLSRSIRKEL